ncbi:hypothetical protein IWX90DRAFT_89023 [Phyllosticta citrichinensis]|uniref:Uncharacterized protein n=1 Tax=Phyllosticta citrichinensis TaxID=1130410 RepID=A0ABR1XFH5_9PEZI
MAPPSCSKGVAASLDDNNWWLFALAGTILNPWVSAPFAVPVVSIAPRYAVGTGYHDGGGGSDVGPWRAAHSVVDAKPILPPRKFFMVLKSDDWSRVGCNPFCSTHSYLHLLHLLKKHGVVPAHQLAHRLVLPTGLGHLSFIVAAIRSLPLPRNCALVSRVYTSSS